MTLFAVYYGLFQTAAEDCEIATVFADRQSAVDWVDETVADDGTPVYGLYVVEFEAGEHPETGEVVYEIEGDA